MAITVIPEQIDSLGADTLRVVGIFTDGQTFKTPFEAILQGSLTAEGIRSRLVGQLLATQSQVEVKKVLQVGIPFDLTAPQSPPSSPPDPPTPEQLAQQAFLSAYRDLQVAQRKVEAGVIKADDADLVALIASVQKFYVSAYLTVE